MAKMLARSGYLGAWGDEVLVGAHGQDRKLKHRIQRRREDEELVRGYVSALWAADWDSPEDSDWDRP